MAYDPMQPLGVDPVVAQALAMQSPAATPFIWGSGGQRIDPNDLAMRRERADQMMQSDYSPVGSVWEGLGRVADNWIGALDAKRVKKDEAALQDQRGSDIAALLGEGNADLAPALSSNDPTVQALAGQVLAARMPKQRNPLEFEQLLAAAGYQPGTPEYQQQARQLLTARNDPFITASLPGGGFYGGPQSGFMTALTGGGDSTISPQPETASPSPANIPNGSPLSGAPSAPQRPQGMSDEQLRQQALEAVRNGAPIDQVFARLQSWGVQP